MYLQIGSQEHTKPLHHKITKLHKRAKQIGNINKLKDEMHNHQT